MTTITYKPGEYSLEISGHSGYAAAGKDIVCAGISTLFFTLVEVAARAGLPEKPRVWMGDGEAGVTVKPDPEHREKIDAVFETVVTGMKLMAEKFPEYVSFKAAADTPPAGSAGTPLGEGGLNRGF